MKRNQIRRLVLFTAFLLFPITMWYFSPAVIIMASSQRIINGSFITFMLMLLFSTLFGRLFCGWLCPGGGLQECAFHLGIQKNPARQGKRDLIKFTIWIIWLAIIITLFVLSKNNVTVHPFFMTDHGISISNIYCYFIYYTVLIILFVPSLIHGRRASCHYICWMSPFMITGSTLARILRLPHLHISAKAEGCISCRRCSTVCPMGLSVEKLVHEGTLGKTNECILCGECADVCPKKILHYAMSGDAD